jgi:hypothetical protein
MLVERGGLMDVLIDTATVVGRDRACGGFQ